ncbi:MAG: hypothetical protein JSW61_07125 [Candidatus Thorarchaeota archaeon]|nr:MAG: hypothetical protein JSW61_07125 [Candidatus Thorarchaeota archaeon]
MRFGVTCLASLLLFLLFTSARGVGPIGPRDSDAGRLTIPVSDDTGFYLQDFSTSFSISIGSKVFFAQSEDSNRFEDLTPVFRIWEQGILLYSIDARGNLAGTSHQTGMNQHGLCMELVGLPFLPTSTDPQKEAWWMSNLLPLRYCTNVSEATEWVLSRNIEIFGDCMPYQIHFADRFGDAVVVSAGIDGELHCTFKDNNHIVCTNFNLQHPENRYGEYPCPRYNTANEMLSAIGSEVDLDHFVIRDVLEAVGIEDISNKSVSYIFDPVNQQAYLYFRHDYSKVLRLDVNGIASNLGDGEELECSLVELYNNGHNFTIDEPSTEEHFLIIVVTGSISAVSILVAFTMIRRRSET